MPTRVVQSLTTSRQPGAPRAAWSRATWRHRLALLVVVALAISGCSYSKEEPGLFSHVEPSQTEGATRQPDRAPPPPTNPLLPVAGETVWTSADGLHVQVRIAVHAVRRMEGATVLDWSVTPLMTPNHSWGDPVPDFLDLGLSGSSLANADIFLVDPKGSKVYRPLSHASRREFDRCLCSPLWVAQLDLHLGQTRMMQVTYPELPPSVAFVDVDMVTLPVFDHLPVTPIGEVPTVRVATNLNRPADPAPLLKPATTFRSVPGQPQLIQSIAVDQVIASPNRTSVEWTLGSVTAQPNFNVLPFEPPVSARLPSQVTVSGSGSASGPELRPVGSQEAPIRAQWMTDSFSHEGLLECMCTALGLWAASLRVAGGEATVTTNYPPLPAGVTQVDLLLPGAGRVSGLPVSRAVDGATRTGDPIAAPSGRWRYADKNPPHGWADTQWPTPLPAPDQLRDFVSTVDQLTSLPRS